MHTQAQGAVGDQEHGVFGTGKVLKGAAMVFLREGSRGIARGLSRVILHAIKSTWDKMEIFRRGGLVVMCALISSMSYLWGPSRINEDDVEQFEHAASVSENCGCASGQGSGMFDLGTVFSMTANLLLKEHFAQKHPYLLALSIHGS